MSRRSRNEDKLADWLDGTLPTLHPGSPDPDMLPDPKVLQMQYNEDNINMLQRCSNILERDQTHGRCPVSKSIPLTRGAVATVDDVDYEHLRAFNWHLTHYGYAARKTWDGEQRHVVYMHRQLLDAQTGQQVDHCNSDKLDNRRQNLRIATHRQNQHNEPKRNLPNASSRYKGVKKSPRSRRWTAQIHFDGELHPLGLFESEREAGLAYDRAAREHFGEYAWLNFPEEARDF